MKPETKTSLPLAWLRALRPWQWSKNLLLAVPLLAAHKVGEPGKLLHLVLAFVAFCLAASAGYVVNDLNDRDSDRRHVVKCHRPFASGRLSLGVGLLAIFLLIAASCALSAACLPRNFNAALLLYVLLTVAYSLVLKQRLLVDVIVLAGLYALRVLAGGAAAGVEVSAWLLAFSMFFFLSLAFAKRYAELRNSGPSGQESAPGRGYLVADLDIIRAVGPTSGYLAVLVLAQYINSEKVVSLYTHPLVLWLVCPLLLYWITRIWFLAQRGTLRDDPLTFALTDSRSYLVGALIVLLMVLAAVRHVHS